VGIHGGDELTKAVVVTFLFGENIKAQVFPRDEPIETYSDEDSE
jgi:hypothetical protein